MWNPLVTQRDLGRWSRHRNGVVAELYGRSVSTIPTPASVPVPGQPLVWIGPNVHATADVVVTPAGTWPLRETNVVTMDQTSTSTRTPAWVIALVVLFIWFFFLSLLLLLVRERTVTGYVAVQITCGPYAYTEQVPIRSDVERADTMNRVTYLQSLIGSTRRMPPPA